jgi:hypothetical protein
MNAHLGVACFSLGLLLLAGGPQLHADISVRLSVKFILNFDGTRPPGIGTNNTFQVEVDRGNGILAATGRGVRLQVVEYIDIQPAAPQGQSADYWFNLGARSNRMTMESAALADTTTWRWNNSAINIYVNNTGSGQCSFVNGGSSISLGQSISTGTVLHEIGHFFNLQHTHANDPDCSTFTPTQPLNTYLANGDSLASTINDHACFTQDQLSTANFGANYAALTPAQQRAVNTSWLNVMSYHQEDQLNDDQMDIWSDNANVSRLFVCSGRTWFVSNAGSDIWTGDSAFAPFATVQRALSAVGASDDIIMLRSGNYTAPGFMNTPCTFRAMRGPVSITRQ